MRLRTLLPMLAAVIFAGCKLESSNCPRLVEVPFISVSVPDSVKAGQLFTIDMQLYDYGCYQTTKAYGKIVGDTVYLSAYADYDECGCPSVSKGLEQSYIITTVASNRNSTRYFVYLTLNQGRDSICARLDSVLLY